MPTKDECQELYKNTTQSWVTINGVDGRKFTSKTDTTKYIFIPAAGNCGYGSVFDVGNYGYVWSSSLNAGSPDSAWSLYSVPGFCISESNFHYFGQPVRGVL